MELYHILKLAFLIIPIILGGIFNMVFVKLPVLKLLKKPMDGGKILSDGERLFGDNKTWKGFFGMIVLTAFWMWTAGICYNNAQWVREISPLDYSSFTLPFNEWFYGAMWGFGYVLFELPNSFIKRRMKIDPGKQAHGFKGVLFAFFDQADSVIGCIIFMLLFFVPTPLEAVVIFLMGTGFHYVINILLYLADLKKQAG